jgi:hypothetical protein
MPVFEINWDVVSSVSASIATILAVVGIAIAWSATRTAKGSTDLARRTYIDSLYRDLETRMNAYGMVTLPYWNTVPVLGELQSGNLRVEVAREVGQKTHGAVLEVISAINLLKMTGLGDIDTDRSNRNFRSSLQLLEAAFWTTYFFNQQISKAEAARWASTTGTGQGENAGLTQPWEDAWAEVRESLSGEGHLPDFESSIIVARELAEEAYAIKEHPTTGRSNLADAVLSGSKELFRDRFYELVRREAPWTGSDGRAVKRSAA